MTQVFEVMMKNFLIGAAVLALFSGSTFAAGANVAHTGRQRCQRRARREGITGPEYDLQGRASPAPKVDEVNPGLTVVVRYLNTLAKYSVAADHRKIAVVFHRGATNIVLKDDKFKERTGHDNPNIALIQQMKKAWVDFRVCGQAVLANKIEPKTIQPEIELDLWAMTTIVNLQLRGYVHLGGGAN
jgi:intracellular sulfur oxidation DsrE/DsrF family protein